MEDAAVVDHATKSFGDVVAVDDISFRVPTGSILGVIGPSGSGKTTTIRLLTGSVEPTNGAVSVLGEDPRHFRRTTRQRLGYMPQQFTLYPDLTARENVDFVASLYGLLLFRRQRRVREVLRLVDLWDARSRRAGRMSGGMQRRLELACALVHDPVLALLDEPTAGVDPILRTSIWAELRRFRDEGRTLIVTTQYVSEAAECDQVALIAEGHLVALATPDDLRRQATGGDLLQLSTDRPFDGSGLSSLPEVRSVERLDPRRFRLNVRDGASDTPDIIAAVEAKGVEVVSIEEVRPSFDEVFALLVERDRDATRAAVSPAEAAPANVTPTEVTPPEAAPPEAAPPEAAPPESAPPESAPPEAAPSDATPRDATPTDETPTDAKAPEADPS